MSWEYSTSTKHSPRGNELFQSYTLGLCKIWILFSSRTQCIATIRWNVPATHFTSFPAPFSIWPEHHISRSNILNYMRGLLCSCIQRDEVKRSFRHLEIDLPTRGQLDLLTMISLKSPKMLVMATCTSYRTGYPQSSTLSLPGHSTVLVYSYRQAMQRSMPFSAVYIQTT